ncbi:MAG: hypothetical protein HY282_16840 [Nitrospirae bacterium]|nr:hypothetical protein [Candidatus Manganitrophaceae bacterium]
MNTLLRVWTKQTALFFVLIYLFSTGLITVRAEGHLLSHGEHAGHAKRHASFLCSWICAASAFVPTAEQALDHRSIPTAEDRTVESEEPLRPHSFFAYTIRPPPPFPL